MPQRRPRYRPAADLEFRRPREATFLAAYGPVATEQLLRARVLALFLCAALAVYADREGMDKVKREPIAGLARASAD